MAIQGINSGDAGRKDRGHNPGYVETQENFVANTSSEKRYHLAPCDGKLVEVEVQVTVTSDATKTYTFVVTNKSTGKTMAASQAFDDDPVATAYSKVTLTLSSTEADVAVSEGDMIEVDMTGGTGSGLAACKFRYDNV